jgi:transposase-like protein
MRIESHNLDGRGWRRVQVYDLPPAANAYEYWAAVTDVSCPCCPAGTIRWAEAGYVPGYRICDRCGRHYLADGTAAAPTLLRVGQRRSRVWRGT